MTKHKTIKRFLNIIKKEINFNSVLIVDYWDSDLCAVGLKKINKLIYVSTFNYCDETIIKYDYISEIFDNENQTFNHEVDKGVGISELEIIDIVKTFFNE